MAWRSKTPWALPDTTVSRRSIYFELTASCLRGLDKYCTEWQIVEEATKARYLPDGNLNVNTEAVIHFFNKEVMVYFEEGAGLNHGMIGRYLYRAWLHHFDGRPPFQRGGYFAKAMRFGKARVVTLDDLSKYYERLSRSLRDKLDQPAHFCLYHENLGTSLRESRPLSSPAIQSSRKHKYLIRPLFRALYMVFDGQQLYKSDWTRLSNLSGIFWRWKSLLPLTLPR
jgi:hypothetical protein